jgi:MFS family permease
MEFKNQIKITLLLASMLTILANAIISPALPEIKNAFIGIENIEVISKLLMTLPALTIAVFASSIGSLLDKIGRRKILISSLIVYVLAGTSGYWLTDLYQILVGRFLLGFGVAGVMTASTTLIGDYFKGEERQEFISWQGAFSGFGGMLFITLAGYLADTSWHLPFTVYLFGLVPLVLSLLFLKEPAMQLNSQIKNTIATESIANNTAVYFVYFFGFVGILLFYILPLQIPFYIKGFSNVSNSMAGIAIGVLTTAQAISSFFYKNLKAKFQYTSIYGISFLVLASGFVVIGLASSYNVVLVGLIIAGISTAWLLPNSNLWLMSITPEHQRGKFIGRLTTFLFFGQFFSPIIVQPLQNAFGLKQTFIILAIFLFVLATFSFLFVPKIISKTPAKSA